MASPLRKTPSDFAYPTFQSSSVISFPCGVNQAMSLTSLPCRGRPWNQRRRWKMRCLLRRSTSMRVKSRSASSTFFQSYQEILLSWQSALLLLVCVRAPARLRVEVRASREPVGELAERRVLAAPVVAHRVAVLAVPFAPQRGEVADLVTALPDVPRLGDELHPADDGVLLDEIEEGR